jgi:hypothetical protein
MPHVLVAIVAALAVLLASPAAVAQTALDESDPLTVRVYDLGGVESAGLAHALRDARAIFFDAGIASEWHDCTRGSRSAAPVCAGPRHADDLIVRILRRHEIGDGLPKALGASVVESGRGVLATVFLDLVEPVARRTGSDEHVLLGRAIAHEVGHLMLGTSAHSTTGLMREIWTDRELGRHDDRDWRFEPGERAVLHQARTRLARQQPARPGTDDRNVAHDVLAR